MNETHPVLYVIGFVVILIIVWIILASIAAKKRAEYLYRKYGRTEIAEAIIARKYWPGQSSGQLRDSLGEPVDTDEKVLKTKTKVIWKYHHRGGNRYGLRITVENGLVVGWDEKM